MVGRKRTKLAPYSVSVGSCKLDIANPDGSKLKPAGQPSDRPIQLACMRRTFSGQRVSPSSAPRDHRKNPRFSETIGSARAARRRTRPPALAVNYLFVCQNGVINRVPIDNAFCAGQQGRPPESPETWPVRGVIDGSQLQIRATNQRKPQALQLRAHGVDIFIVQSPDVCLFIAAFSAGMPNASHPIGCRTLYPCAILNGRHIAHGIIAHMPHVNAPDG